MAIFRRPSEGAPHVEVTQHCHSDSIGVVASKLNVGRERLDHTSKVRLRRAMVMDVVDDPLTLPLSNTSPENPTRDERREKEGGAEEERGPNDRGHTP